MDQVMQSTSAPPDGYVLNSYGGFSRLDMLKPQQVLEDQMVKGLLASASALSERLATFRSEAFDEVDTFIGILTDQYEAPRGGSRGNTTLTTIDGLMKVQIATGDFLTFGPELQVAKSLVDACLTRWSEGARSEIQTIVQDAFDVGKEGKLRVDRILALRGLAITDEQWVKAMAAIGDAIRITHSKRYIRFYRRDQHDGAWVQVAMDMSRVVS